MPATRDNGFRHTRGRVARRVGASSGVVGTAAHGLELLRRLMLGCVLLVSVALVNGCSASAPATVNTTAAATPGSSVRPATTAERPNEVRANGQTSPNARAGEPGVAAPAQAANTSSGEQEDGGGEASAAYEGFYEALGTRPKGFEQFGNFMIRAPQNGRISGAVVPLEGEIHEFASAALAGRKLTFVTRKVGGVHYTFDGQFLAAPPFASNKKAAVAEGLVKKFRGEGLAAEASMKFYFDEGGEDP